MQQSMDPRQSMQQSMFSMQSMPQMHSIQQPMMGSELGYSVQEEIPTSMELEQEIHRILSTSDLTTVSKKDIRGELSRLFQTNLDHRKKEINSIIEHMLQQQ